MAMFMGKNIPVAVFSPKEHMFMPLDILENNKEKLDTEAVKECLKTIQKEEL